MLGAICRAMFEVAVCGAPALQGTVAPGRLMSDIVKLQIAPNEERGNDQLIGSIWVGARLRLRDRSQICGLQVLRRDYL